MMEKNLTFERLSVKDSDAENQIRLNKQLSAYQRPPAGLVV
jgi:hypothetical protein